MSFWIRFKQALNVTDDPVIGRLAADSKDTYSPFTQKMLQSGLSIRTNYFDSNYVALLECNIATGQAAAFELNERFLDKGAPYSTEHEGVHYDQSKVDFRYNSSLYTRVEDRYKIDRVKELEAYGREYHKIIQDHLADPLPCDEIFNVDDDTYNAGLARYVETYGEEPCGTDAESILRGLDRIRDKNIRKEPIDVLPEFMYRRSFDADFMTMVSKTTLQNQHYLLKNFLYNPLTYARIVKEAVAPMQIFQKDIGIADADRLLNRNGGDYLGSLGANKKREFWQNVESLDACQSQIMELTQQLFDPYVPRFGKKPV